MVDRETNTSNLAGGAMEVVTDKAQMQCSFGAAPAMLTVTSNPIVKVNGQLAATIMDMAPMVNIPPFGMCSSPANPTVASATAAAMGVLTPMPCVPVTTPWAPGAVTTQMMVFPTLLTSCKCMCAYGGIISINMSGQGATTTNAT